MSRPLNEYPKEELEWLYRFLFRDLMSIGFMEDKDRTKWISRIREAISDRELADKELPFKTTEQK